MPKPADLRDLVSHVNALSAADRLILAGQLMAKGDPSLTDMAMVIAENVVLDWRAMKILTKG